MSDAAPDHHKPPHSDDLIPLDCIVQPTHARYATARALRQITATLTATCATARTSDEVGATLLDQTCTLLAAPAAALVLRDLLYGDAVIWLAHGAWVVRRGTRIPAGMGICGRVMETQQIHLCHPARCPSWCEWPWLIEDIYSIVGVPLLSDQHMIGVLMLGHQREVTDSTLHLLAALARLAASAFAALPWADTADSSA
jgi:GAF domain-containing protein